MKLSRRRKIAACVAAAVVALGALGPVVYYRGKYHTFAWWEVPPEISYCGREYLRGSTIPSLPTKDWSFTQVMTVYPEGWRVYSKQPLGNDGVNALAPGLPCTMGLVLEQKNDTYVQYGLSGGP